MFKIFENIILSLEIFQIFLSFSIHVSIHKYLNGTMKIIIAKKMK